MDSYQLLQIKDHGDIRITEGGDVSVFDLVRLCSESKSRQYPHYTWKRLAESFPEVLSKTRHCKFPGRRQRETPVISKEDALYLLGLLPGAMGKSYREAAAKLVLAYLESPAELASAAIKRIEDPQQLKETASEAYAKYINKYHPLMGEIKKRGGIGPTTYQHANTVNTKTCMGKEPNLIKAERGGLTARDKATDIELTRLAVLQDLEVGNIKQKDSQGHTELSSAINEVAADFTALLNKYGI